MFNCRFCQSVATAYGLCDRHQGYRQRPDLACRVCGTYEHRNPSCPEFGHDHDRHALTIKPWWSKGDVLA